MTSPAWRGEARRPPLSRSSVGSVESMRGDVGGRRQKCDLDRIAAAGFRTSSTASHYSVECRAASGPHATGALSPTARKNCLFDDRRVITCPPPRRVRIAAYTIAGAAAASHFPRPAVRNRPSLRAVRVFVVRPPSFRHSPSRSISRRTEHTVRGQIWTFLFRPPPHDTVYSSGQHATTVPPSLTGRVPPAFATTVRGVHLSKDFDSNNFFLQFLKLKPQNDHQRVHHRRRFVEFADLRVRPAGGTHAPGQRRFAHRRRYAKTRRGLRWVKNTAINSLLSMFSEVWVYSVIVMYLCVMWRNDWRAKIGNLNLLQVYPQLFNVGPVKSFSDLRQILWNKLTKKSIV